MLNSDAYDVKQNYSEMQFLITRKQQRCKLLSLQNFEDLLWRNSVELKKLITPDSEKKNKDVLFTHHNFLCSVF